MISRLFISFCMFLAVNGLVAQSKNLPSFTSLSTGGNVQVTLIKSNTTKADYTILKGSESDLLIEVVGNELKVKTKSKWNGSSTKAKVDVYYSTLSNVNCAAGSSVYSADVLNNDVMSINTSSGASCNLKVESETLDVKSSSGASIELSGNTQNVNYSASSGSSINAAMLKANIAEADVSSGANIKLYAIKKLKGDASSGGSIKYKGKPESVNLDSGRSGGSIKSF
jgi:Putative auto-transporter adhesin, head GIN domain